MDRNFCFQLLKNIMQNAFQTETNYLTKNQMKNVNIPDEIMQILQPNFYTSDIRLKPANQKENKCLYVVRTNLDFYLIYFFLMTEEKSDIILIGPFRSDTILIETFSKKIEEHPFLSSKYNVFLNYYEMLPCVSLQNIINTICCIADEYLLLEEPMVPVYIDFSNTINNCFEPVETTDMITNQLIDNMDKIIFDLRNAILKGDTQTAQKQLKNFLRETKLLAQKDFLQCKRDLDVIHHTIFTIVYQVQTIYRLNSLKLYVEFMDKIEQVHTTDEAVKMAFDICDAYCMLFQKNIFPEYPKQINQVIHYIHSHLQEKLTLSVLSERFRIAPSKLSASFKQTTGITISAYIQQTRIRQAMDYLHHSIIPVSEVALAVGFSDFAYFSKVFKKHTGHSPTEYRELNSK